jgi:methylglyoxal synthase
VVCNVPTACNRATADFVLSSPLTAAEYVRPGDVYPDPDASSRLVTLGHDTERG